MLGRTIVSSEEKDPTCVLKMLSSLTKPKTQRVGFGLDLERGLGSFRSTPRPSTIVRPTSRVRRGAAVATKLQFDESMCSDRPRVLSSKKKCLESDAEGLNVYPFATAKKKMKLENIDSSARIPASPWEFRLMKADLLQARSQIEVLENRNKELHALKQTQLLDFESETKSLQVQHDMDVNRIRELEERMEIVNARRYECKEELAELKLQLNCNNNTSESTIHTLEKKIADLKDQLHMSEIDNHKIRVASERRETEFEIKLASLLEVVAAHEQQVSELTVKLQQVRQDQSQVEVVNQQLQESLLKIRGLESEKEALKEASALAVSQRQKLLKFAELERELTKIKDDNIMLRELVQNKLLLEEKVSSLESRLACCEERDKEFSHLQAKASSLAASHEEWVVLARDLGSSAKSPGSLRLRFEHLQQKELQLTADSAELKSRLKAALESKTAISSELECLKTQLEKHKSVQEQQTNFIHRQRKKLSLVTQERDYCQSLLNSYEKELTMTSNTAIIMSHQEQQRSHITALEKTLQGYRELVQKLEDDWAKEKEKKLMGFAAPTDKIIELETERDNLKRDNEQLLRKQEELELELRYGTLRGNVNPTKTKILHFKTNPSAEAVAQRRDELFSLREECNRLRERVRILNDSQVKDVTLVVEEKVKAANTKEVQDLQEQLISLNVKIQRMKEAFKKTLSEFREIVYLVWGYRMDFKNGNEYHLSSMYAESPDDILVFQYNSETGEVKMLETPFSSTLQSLINLHLRRQDSIPVFVSAVTLDLFSQQTLQTITEPTVVN